MEKFIAWDEKNNKVWEGMAADEDFAEQFALVDHPDLKGQKLTIKKVDFQEVGEESEARIRKQAENDGAAKKYPSIEEQTRIATKQILDKKSRKPRVDKGVPRKEKADEKPTPATPKTHGRPPSQYFVYGLEAGNHALSDAMTFNEAEKLIVTAPMECANLRLIQGHEVKFQKRIQAIR